MKKWKKTHRQRKKYRTIQLYLNNIAIQQFEEWRIRNYWSKDRAFKEVLKFIKEDYKLFKMSESINIPKDI